MQRKKLLIINSRFLPLIGGGETYVLELMKHFSRNGYEVHLATRETGYPDNTWQDCTLHVIPGFDDQHQDPYRCIPALRKLLDSVKPDLVHVHNLLPYFAYSHAADRAEFPTVLTIHNTPLIPVRLTGVFNDFIADRIFTRQLLANGGFDRLLLGSEYYRSQYVNVAPWIEEKSQVVHYFPPDACRGPGTVRPTFTQPEFTLLFPSRLIKRKGMEEALRALAQLPAGYKLLIPAFAAAEDKAYQAHIARLIGKLELPGRVELGMAPVPPDKMAEYYRRSDAVLIPSHYEGFGIAAVEAMSWGLPLIASDVGGLQEIITSGTDGILIPPRDHAAIAGAVQLVADDPAYRQRLAEAAIKKVDSSFSRQYHMEQIMKVYQDVTS